MQKIHEAAKLSRISNVRRHSKLKVDKFDIKGRNFANFHGFENIVGRILSFFEFGNNSTQNFVEDVV